MNVIKGLDRIVLVIAILAVVPGFFSGIYLTIEGFKTETAEHQEWQNKWNDRVNYLRKEKAKAHEEYIDRLKQDYEKKKIILLESRIKKIRKQQELERLLIALPDSEDAVLQDLNAIKPSVYNYPPIWFGIIGGIVAVPISFFIVLFGLKGLSRGIRRFSLWIAEGFRD